MCTKLAPIRGIDEANQMILHTVVELVKIFFFSFFNSVEKCGASDCLKNTAAHFHAH